MTTISQILKQSSIAILCASALSSCSDNLNREENYQISSLLITHDLHPNNTLHPTTYHMQIVDNDSHHVFSGYHPAPLIGIRGQEIPSIQVLVAGSLAVGAVYEGKTCFFPTSNNNFPETNCDMKGNPINSDLAQDYLDDFLESWRDVRTLSPTENERRKLGLAYEQAEHLDALGEYDISVNN